MGTLGQPWAGTCHDGQDNIGGMCTAACECASGLLCSWHAGSLGAEDSDQVACADVCWRMLTYVVFVACW